MLAVKAILASGGRVVISTKDHPDPDHPSEDFLNIEDRTALLGPDATASVVHGDHAYLIEQDPEDVFSDPFKYVPGTNTILAMRLYNPWGATSDHPWVIAEDLVKFVEGIYELR